MPIRSTLEFANFIILFATAIKIYLLKKSASLNSPGLQSDDINQKEFSYYEIIRLKTTTLMCKKQPYSTFETTSHWAITSPKNQIGFSR